MITLTMNGLPVMVEEGSTLLEAARYLGIDIPTLCHMDGLSPYGACRLCVVEIGVAPNAKLVSACTYPAVEGLKVRTGSSRVMRARRMVLELLLASCPQSKIIQDLASAYEIRQQRFRQEHEDCILCGLCVRMCDGTDDGRRHRISRARRAPQHRDALRRCVGGLPPVRRLHVRLSGLPAPLHLQ